MNCYLCYQENKQTTAINTAVLYKYCKCGRVIEEKCKHNTVIFSIDRCACGQLALSSLKR
jgi:hypothetical protein